MISIDFFQESTTSDKPLIFYNPGGSAFDCMPNPMTNWSTLSQWQIDWKLSSIEMDFKWYLCNASSLLDCQNTMEPFPHQIWRSRISSKGELFASYPEDPDEAEEIEVRLRCAKAESWREVVAYSALPFRFISTCFLLLWWYKLATETSNKEFYDRWVSSTIDSIHTNMGHSV